MNGTRRLQLGLLPVLLVWLVAMVAAVPGRAGSFVAFSLAEAQKRHAGGAADPGLAELGGITRLAALVVDRAAGDVVVVGQAIAGEEPLRLDDLAVALRAALVHGQAPLVSIDRTPETASTGRQSVRFEGGVEDTDFGAKLLAADVVLKKLALGKLPTDVWGFPSYFDLLARQGASGRSGTSLFWFYIPEGRSLVSRKDVVALAEVRVAVTTMTVPTDAAAAPQVDALDQAFSDSVSAHYHELAAAHPEVRRLKGLFDLVALATGLGELTPRPDVGYWLTGYRPATSATPKDYSLVVRREEAEGRDGPRAVELSGGIDLTAYVRSLQDGDATALREVVLRSRPKERVLSWQVPLEGWEIPGWPVATVAGPSVARGSKDGGRVKGTMLSGTITGGAPRGPLLSALPPRLSLPSPMPPIRPASLPRFDSRPSLPPMPRLTRDIGGVMLSGTGVADPTAEVAFEGGGFSLILDGQNARLAPEAMRRLVTALWAVYFSRQPPGVSIDPIAPGVVDKHLVRYIGHGVVNSDLGRVMREADYQMKKWVVGTERPNIARFADVDTLMGRLGTRALNVSRRFWFVPEDLRFKKSDGMLLFEGGHMKIKTEHELEKHGVPAEPADGAFRDFFNKHYDEIARKHPIFAELQDYGRMVALARFLKQKQVPLLWFLLANADLVPTEDSPGTVSELVKPSKSFAGATIYGGVDLGTDARYVLDAAAQRALAEAVARAPRSGIAPAPSAPTTAPPPREPLSVRLTDRSYTVLPPSSGGVGSDRAGKLYRTDVALRRDDGEPGLELVRYFDPARPEGGEFGQGWRLLVPYRVEPEGTGYERVGNALLPRRMAVLDLLRGTREPLTFSAERYAIAGWVPDKPEASRLLGLFPLTDGSYRLVSKLGSNFHFEHTGHLTDLLLSPDYQVHLEHADPLLDAFAEAPYAMRPLGDERVQAANVLVPRRMTVQQLPDGENEVFVFDAKARIVGWRPERGEASRFRFLAIMADASFRLADAHGREILLDPGGRFVGLLPADGERLVTALVQGEQRIELTYTLDSSGRLRIAAARVAGPKPFQVRYRYDDESRLARVEREGTAVR